MSSQSHSDSAIAFDNLALTYDSAAANIALSRWLRERVWHRLALTFQPGDHILEIGCGTGEDAIWLAKRGIHVTATDGSTAMLDIAQQKADQANVGTLIEFRQLDLADTANWQLHQRTYDGAFSNFGALNCIGDWHSLASTLAKTIRPGGKLGVGVMPPFCAWESIWHLLRLRVRHASRRWSGKSQAKIDGMNFPVYYPTPQRLRRDFEPRFRQRYLMGLGVFIPPSDLYEAISRYPRMAHILMFLERKMALYPPFKYIGDHFWLEMERIID
jgi:SAM-dependent methyltransferase